MIDKMQAFATRMDLFRMAGWLVMGMFFYSCSILVGSDRPQLQLALWKLGNVTMFAFVGYWLARRAIGRLKVTMDGRYTQSEAMIIAANVVARALVVGCAILAASGL